MANSRGGRTSRDVCHLGLSGDVAYEEVARARHGLSLCPGQSAASAFSADSLHDQSMVLAVDSRERSSDERAALCALLSTVNANLRVIATSRVPLRI
jgi:hypothetical protein